MSFMVRDGEAKPAPRGVLYVVATPIGNPADITLRAIEVLREADLVACEDTRRTGLLLAAHRIRKPLLSYFEHNEERRVPELIARLCAGESVALVTDAGTPCISDPGFRLVRAAHRAGLGVTVVPGPCAAVAALSAAGIPTDRFTFEGFLPSRAAARKRAIEDLRGERRTMVFFEAGRRLRQTLSEMAALFGAEREAAVVREITKTHEETIRASLGEIVERFTLGEPLGEVTIVVEGAREGMRASGEGESAESMLDAMIEAGVGLKQASAVVAKLKGLSRREVYNQALKSHRPPRD
jgi:16S rRNA (cytidine1402-2'-O)-methyltransferase